MKLTRLGRQIARWVGIGKIPDAAGARRFEDEGDNKLHTFHTPHYPQPPNSPTDNAHAGHTSSQPFTAWSALPEHLRHRNARQ